MTDDPPWLSLTEAAARTGLDREAIRSRARRNLLPSRRGNDGQMLVQVTTDLLTAHDRGAAEQVTGSSRAAAEEIAALRSVMTDLLAEVTDLRAALSRAEAEREAAKTVAVAEVATARAEASAAELVKAAEIASRERLIDELRAELARLRRPWWRRVLS